MKRPFWAVAIGTSWGGLNALRTIFNGLTNPACPPIFVVQHRHRTADNLLIPLLQQMTTLRVREVENNEQILPATIYLAPPDYHLLVETNLSLSLSIDARIHFSRPAIDVLFETAADAYTNHLVGILLTGSNQDGTNGLRKIKQRGGYTIAQDPTTAEADLMPRTAIETKVIHKVMTLDQIATFLQRLRLDTQ